MRYQYKVREIGKEYAVEYTNKHNNFISTTLKGKEPK